MIRDWLAVARDVIVVLTGVTGLAFAVYRYRKGREAEAVLQIEPVVEIYPATFSNIVSIGIQIKNVGKAAAYVLPAQVKESICSIRKVSCSNCHERLHWEELEQLKLIEGLYYLSDKDWESYYPEEPFIFEPSTTEIYRVFFATDYHGPIWIRIILVDRKDYKWRADQLFVLP